MKFPKILVYNYEFLILPSKCAYFVTAILAVS